MDKGDSALEREKLPQHVALIMDGNRRWADSRGVRVVEGHRKGVEALVEILKTGFQEFKIPYMTVYAFSEENNERSAVELGELFELFGEVIRAHKREILDLGVQVKVIGQYTKLNKHLVSEVEKLMEETAHLQGGCLTVALNYSGRTEILDAIKTLLPECLNGSVCLEDLTWGNFRQHLYTKGMPDPDLLIRTSGERRISNFLISQIAYSELYFTPVLWPDFGREEFINALVDYSKRERRFGGNMQLVRIEIKND